MPRFAANVFYLFNEVPFLDRFRAAAAAGFQAVEYPYPYQTDLQDSLAGVTDNNLQVVFVTAPIGDWQNGERGMAALPGRGEEFRSTIKTAIQYALALKAGNIHVMAGLVGTSLATHEAFETYVANLRFAAEACASHGLRVLIEPINTGDVPGYFLGDTDIAIRVLEKVDRDNLLIMYDTYHGAINGEDLCMTIRSQLEKIGHIQVAGYPGRAEPTGGDIDYPALFADLDEWGYSGWVGCEYRPCADTVSGLSWAAPYGIGPSA